MPSASGSLTADRSGYRVAMTEPVIEVVGVYDADGGVVGEVSYVVGHLLGRTSCSLCELTHGSLRRRPEWDALVARLPVPLRVMHRNEASEDERRAWSVSGLPAVIGVRSDGTRSVLIGPTGLAALAGSVPAFERALLDALSVGGLRPGALLPGAVAPPPPPPADRGPPASLRWSHAARPDLPPAARVGR